MALGPPWSIDLDRNIMWTELQHGNKDDVRPALETKETRHSSCLKHFSRDDALGTDGSRNNHGTYPTQRLAIPD